MIRRIVLVGALLLVACSAWSHLVSPEYPEPDCGYGGVTCGDGTCCPAQHRCDNKNGTCVFDPDMDNPWLKLSPDAAH